MNRARTTTKPLTPRQFVGRQDRCPRCGTEIQFGWGAMEIDDNSAYQHVTCDTCGLPFDAIYRLVGYLSPDVEDGTPQTITEDFCRISEHPAESHEKQGKAVWRFEARMGKTDPEFPVEIWLTAGSPAAEQHLNNYVSFEAARKDYPAIELAKPSQKPRKSRKGTV